MALVALLLPQKMNLRQRQERRVGQTGGKAHHNLGWHIILFPDAETEIEPTFPQPQLTLSNLLRACFFCWLLVNDSASDKAALLNSTCGRTATHESGACTAWLWRVWPRQELHHNCLMCFLAM